MEKIIILFFTLLFAFKGKSQMIWAVEAKLNNRPEDSILNVEGIIDWGGRDSSEYSNITSVSLDGLEFKVISDWVQTSPIDDTPCVFIAKSKPLDDDEKITQLNLMPIDDNLFAIIFTYKGNNWCTAIFNRKNKHRKEDAPTKNN